MKIRYGFVSNSSSTSFVIKIWNGVKTLDDFLKYTMLVSEWHKLYRKKYHHRYGALKSDEYNMIRIYEEIWEDVQRHIVPVEEAKKFLKDYSPGNQFDDNIYHDCLEVMQNLDKTKVNWELFEIIYGVFRQACDKKIDEDENGFFTGLDEFKYAIVSYADEDGWWSGLIESGSHWNIPEEIGTVKVISHH